MKYPFGSLVFEALYHAEIVTQRDTIVKPVNIDRIVESMYAQYEFQISNVKYQTTT